MNGQQLRVMREELEKTAGWMKDDLPWYTTAAGATGATLAAGKLVPKKYKAVGQIGGALLGTAAGLEGGKAIGRAFEKPKPAMPKVASPQLVDSLPETADVNPEEDGPPPPPPPKDMSKERKPLGHPAAILGKSVAGLGLGMAGGYAGMKGLDYGLKKVRGKGLPTSKLTWAIPATTAVLGMAYPYLHQATVDKMREAHLERLGKKRGG